jgi:dienelactone hydrolase
MAAWGAAPYGFAQRGYPGTPYRNYSRCLPDYLRDLAARAYARRNRELVKLTTRAAIRARQRWARATFWKLVGGMPQRTPLNARTLDVLKRPDYEIEKIVYESRPNFHVPALLYLPSGPAPYPSVLFQMGHSANGKAYDGYQRCCQGLVKLGFMVLAFDPMGQGERIYYPGPMAQSRVGSPVDEHSVPGRQMLLYGDTATRMQVWDAVRGLDYLAAHPLADPKRIGATGQSGGGTLTMLLAAVDDRLAAAVVCSGNTENFACANFNPPGSTDDAEQNLLGSGPLGFDRWDLLYPLAPKPLLVNVSDKDSFGTYSPNYIASGWEEFQKLRKVYELLGAGDRLGWVSTSLPHSLAYDSRLSVYNWFSRWLKGEKERIDHEPEVEPEPDRALWVSPAGNVVKSFGGPTPFLINKSRKVTRRKVDLAELLVIGRPAPGLRMTVLRRAPSREVDIEAVEVQTAARVWVPAWLFLPRQGKVRSASLLLEPSSRNQRWNEGGLYQKLAASGTAVCVASLRGVDDLAPEFGRGAARYARSRNEEECYAWASLILGRPMLGQWVTDTLALTAALRARSEFSGALLTVAALEKMTVPALCAAALDPAIGSLYLAHGLISFQSVVETEIYSASFSNFVSGFLNCTDLPEIAASFAPRKLVLAGSVDGTGTEADPAVVRRLYPGKHVDIVPDSGWDLQHRHRFNGQS